MKTWDALANFVAGHRLIVAKIDMSKNEVNMPMPGLPGYPKIIFYPFDDRRATPYVGSYTLNGF